MPKRNPKHSPLAQQRREAKKQRKESNVLMRGTVVSDTPDARPDEDYPSENVMGMPKTIDIHIDGEGKITARLERPATELEKLGAMLGAFERGKKRSE